MPAQTINIVFVKYLEAFKHGDEIDFLMSFFKQKLTQKFPGVQFNVTYQPAYTGAVAKAHLKFILQGHSTGTRAEPIWQTQPVKYPIDATLGIGSSNTEVDGGTSDIRMIEGRPRKIDEKSSATINGLKKLFSCVEAYIARQNMDEAKLSNASLETKAAAPAPAAAEDPSKPAETTKTRGSSSQPVKAEAAAAPYKTTKTPVPTALGETDSKTKAVLIEKEQKQPFKNLLDDLFRYGQSTPSWYWLSSRNLNAALNRELARKLHSLLSEAKTSAEVQQIISKAHVNHVRLEIIASQPGGDLRKNPDFVERPINSKKLTAILEAARKHFPEPKLEDRQTKVDSITLDLKNYISRVQHTPSYGFSFFVASRTQSRVLNSKLAHRLVYELSQAKSNEAVAAIFTPKRIAELRQLDIPQQSNFKDRGMNSTELQKAIDRARDLFPAGIQPKVQQEESVTPKAM